MYAIRSYYVSLVIDSPELSQALGVDKAYFHIGLITFGILYSPLSSIIGIGMNIFSRKNEYEADAFAAENYDADVITSYSIHYTKLYESTTGTTISSKTQEVPEEANFSKDQQGAQKQGNMVSEKTQRIFGYKLFNQDKLSFEPSVNIPVPNDYVIGIGDELSISVWGASQQTYMLEVDGNGSVYIPDLGPVKVVGQNFASVRSGLIRRLSAIYSGMNGDSPNTFAEVSINNLRSIKVNVIGEAMNPGTYTLPASYNFV